MESVNSSAFFRNALESLANTTNYCTLCLMVMNSKSSPHLPLVLDLSTCCDGEVSATPKTITQNPCTHETRWCVRAYSIAEWIVC